MAENCKTDILTPKESKKLSEKVLGQLLH